MHITINTITREVIIHDLTLTKTDIIIKMLQAIGEDAHNWQIVNYSNNKNEKIKNTKKA